MNKLIKNRSVGYGSHSDNGKNIGGGYILKLKAIINNFF